MGMIINPYAFASAPSGFFFGLKTNNGGGSPTSGDRAWASRWQCPSNGTIFQLTFAQKNNPSGLAKMLVFADLGTAPGSLLASSASVTVGAVTTVGALSLAVTAGTWYWLGFVTDGSAFGDVFQTSGGGLPSANRNCVKLAYSFTTPPSTFGTPDGNDTSESLEIWADCL